MTLDSAVQIDLLGLLVIGVIFYFAVISPLSSKVKSLQSEIQKLKKAMADLQSSAHKPTPHAQPAKVHAPHVVEKEKVPVRTQKSANDLQQLFTKKINFEEQFGARLPVWIGSIALILAGFYMIKYSIEAKLLSPAVRLVISFLFGTGLIAASYFIQCFTKIANRTKISQATGGAGVAILYFTAYAATSIYSFLPYLAGFIAMGAITAMCILLALKLGPPIALIGLVGGFLAPILLKEELNIGVLYMYLYLLVLGTLLLVRKNNLWWLASLSIGTAYLSVLYWNYHFFSPNYNVWTGLSLIAAACVLAAILVLVRKNIILLTIGSFLGALFICSLYWNFFVFKPEYSLWIGFFLLATVSTVVCTARKNTPDIVLVLALLGALILMSFVLQSTTYSAAEWAMYGALTLGSVTLAALNFARYKVYPWVALIVLAPNLYGWQHASLLPQSLKIISIFGLIYLSVSYCLMGIKKQPAVYWGCLAAAVNLVFYYAIYWQVTKYSESYFINNFFHLPYFNLLAKPVLAKLAFFFVAFWALNLLLITKLRSANHKAYGYLFALSICMITAFITIGLLILYDSKILAILLAAEVCVITIVNGAVKIDLLNKICKYLTWAGFACLAWQYVFSYFLITQSPILYLGIPALLYAGAAAVLIKVKDINNDPSHEFVLGFVPVFLLALMGWYEIRTMSQYLEHFAINVDFLANGIFVNYLLLLIIVGFSMVWDKFKLVATGYAAAFMLFAFVLAEILNAALLNSHTNIAVGNMIVVNSLTLAFALPAIWLLLCARPMNTFIRKFLITGMEVRIFSGLLGFIWITASIRQYFHGSHLFSGNTTNLEIYTYSIVWLILALFMLYVGARINNKMLRVSSLILLILTVCKVFLYDASALTGLLRVISFLGLGISLIGISWFYARFVFADKK